MVWKGRHRNITQCHLHLFHQKDGQQSIMGDLSALLPGVKTETTGTSIKLEDPLRPSSLLGAVSDFR